MPSAAGPVIVVDDDDAVRQSLKFALELEGLDVRLYPGGAELLADARPLEGGCLVLDQKMPQMTGRELFARLKSRQICLPAILITASVTPEIERAAVEEGFIKVLRKPLDDGSLLDTIRGALALSPAP
jgi:two-component system response regulator FixJ